MGQENLYGSISGLLLSALFTCWNGKKFSIGFCKLAVPCGILWLFQESFSEWKELQGVGYNLGWVSCHQLTCYAEEECNGNDLPIYKLLSLDKVCGSQKERVANVSLSSTSSAYVTKTWVCHCRRNHPGEGLHDWQGCRWCYTASIWSLHVMGIIWRWDVF